MLTPRFWYDVLVQLHESGGETTMGELASRLLISPSTCTRVVGRMVEAGLVERRVDPIDARVRHAAITREGKQRLRAAAVTHLAGVERHFGRFVPDADAATLRDRFERMRGSALGDN